MAKCVNRTRMPALPAIANMVDWFGWLMVFNATFNNISDISWRSVSLVEDTGENH